MLYTYMCTDNHSERIRRIQVKLQYSGDASGDLVDDKAELFLSLIRSIAIRRTDAINPPPVDADGAIAWSTIRLDQ
jgi:hypothetical protein